ncbi:MAG: hypothetical protein V4622_11115 [Bacteroidota bacterium]
MRKVTLLIAIQVVFSTLLFSQTGRLAFTDDISGGLHQVIYHRQEENLNTGKIDTNAHIKFYNGNFRFAGSIIGKKIFEDSDSPFYIGEYIQFNLGVGIGEKSGSSGSTYNGKTFNLLVGFNVGAAASYSISEELTVGLKWIALGGDIYYDLDQNPVYLNGMTFHPTAQYKNFWASAGFGGKTSKEGDKYKTLDLEFRYNFSEDQEESKYVGVRYQTNGYKTDSNSTSSNDGGVTFQTTTYRQSESIRSIGIFFGFFF